MTTLLHASTKARHMERWPRRDLSRLTRIAFGYVAVWVADALFHASQAYRIGLALGGTRI